MKAGWGPVFVPPRVRGQRWVFGVGVAVVGDFWRTATPYPWSVACSGILSIDRECRLSGTVFEDVSMSIHGTLESYLDLL